MRSASSFEVAKRCVPGAQYKGATATIAADTTGATDRDLQNLGCVQAEIATDLGSAATGSGGRACERANKTT
jgi:hypothetical protein